MFKTKHNIILVDCCILNIDVSAESQKCGTLKRTITHVVHSNIANHRNADEVQSGLT